MKKARGSKRFVQAVAVALIVMLLGSLAVSGMPSASAEDTSGQTETNNFFQTMLFNDLKVAENSTAYKFFPSNNTVQLEANEPGHFIAFEFPVDQEGVYDLHILPWRAASYAKYKVSIDGQLAKEVDFYGTSKEMEYLTAMKLEKGTHIIKFEYSGKSPGSTNYKMGVTDLYLVSHHSLPFKDLKETGRSAGLETAVQGDGVLVRSTEPGQFIEFELPVSSPVCIASAWKASPHQAEGR
ncbi:hypothetical protein N6H14_21935 [Paenibacillus sp. CC-CFT747]|nr:hypothetical protein N6H14_21935 [Paenibacillus sp. CC-CFT747]